MYLYNAFKTVIKKLLFLPCPYKTTPKTLKKTHPKTNDQADQLSYITLNSILVESKFLKHNYKILDFFSFRRDL